MLRPRTLPELLESSFSGPDARPVLVAGDGSVVTYGELWGIVTRVAGGLRSLGVRRGDRVCAVVDKSPEAVGLYLGCACSGAIFVPIAPGTTPAELAELVVAVDPVLVVDGPRLHELVRSAPDRAAMSELEPEDVAALVFTSGTTGARKAASLTHGNLAAGGRSLVEAWGFDRRDVLVHCLPISHVHGLFVALNTALAAGASMRFLARFETAPALEALGGASVFMGVPTYYTRLLADERLDSGRCDSVRLFVCGSAPLLERTHRHFSERTGHSIVERYGMTETLIIASNPLVGDRRPGTVGRALSGTELRLSDSGEVEVLGPSVSPGYWDRPQDTAASRTPDGYFRTGDLGELDPDGYLRLVGRSKDLVISGGMNVSPLEVEGVLDSLDGVEESAVVGAPDDDLGEAVVAFVVARPGHLLDPASLRAAARAQLSGYKVPRRLVVVDDLPRNSMGKVMKAELRRLVAGQDLEGAGPS